MPRRFFRKVMPSVDRVREYRVLGVFGDRLFHPALWHVNRRSASGAVAIGMFCGLIPGPLQMLGAAIACVIARVNLPIALFTTFYTNPLTIVPLYVAAYYIGAWVTGASKTHPMTPPPEWVWSDPLGSMEHLGKWMVGLGPPLAVGVFILACVLAVLGYVVVRSVWGYQLRRVWHRRRRNAARARERAVP